MLKRAKAERVIKSHQLSDIILPPAPRNGDPQPWTRRELGMIMGPALLAWTSPPSRPIFSAPSTVAPALCAHF